MLLLGVVFVGCGGLPGGEPKGALSSPKTNVDASGQREHKALSDHNIQALAIALHEYNNAQGHFPPAVVLGPDGKTHHSWRVEILPYIEGSSESRGRPGHSYKELYEHYNLNEPWDGPNNRQLLQQMPDIFRAPTDPPRSTDTVYFALVGEGAIFDGSKGTPVADINDGSSRTILLVESRPSAPWTKPTDIAFDPTKPVPKLGGVYAGGFIAVDAGVRRHFISSDIKEPHLRALITRDGKENEYDFPKSSALRVR